jgi:hypothetical protein
MLFQMMCASASSISQKNRAASRWLIQRLAVCGCFQKWTEPNVGVLLDVGHALFAHENAAQTAVLLHNEKYLDLIHFNDNYGDWDWDMVPGTIRFWEMLELIFWLQEIGYAGFYSIDIISPRSPAIDAVKLSVENIRRMFRMASTLDRDCMYANLYGKNPIANLNCCQTRYFERLTDKHQLHPWRIV